MCKGETVGGGAVFLIPFFSAGLNHAISRETQAPSLGMGSSRSSQAKDTQKPSRPRVGL